MLNNIPNDDLSRSWAEAALSNSVRLPRVDTGITLVWDEMVKEGKISSQFALGDDIKLPSVLLRKGDVVEVGLRWDPKEGVKQHANLLIAPDRPVPIKEDVIPRIVPGTLHFSALLNPYRLLRPGAVRPNPPLGRLPEPKKVAADGSGCPFGCNPVDVLTAQSLLIRDKLLLLNAGSTSMPLSESWIVLYNTSFIEFRGHGLIVPGRELEVSELMAGLYRVRVGEKGLLYNLPHRPQALSRSLIADVLAYARTVADEEIVFFNAMGAGATVDHFHAQTVVRSGEYAIDDFGRFDRKDFGELRLAEGRAVKISLISPGYPASGLVFDTEELGERCSEALTLFVEHLQNNNRPFNLIFSNGRAYLFPRDLDHQIVAEFPFGIMAAMELCGRGIYSEKTSFDALTEERFCRALIKSTFPRNQEELTRKLELVKKQEALGPRNGPLGNANVTLKDLFAGMPALELAAKD